ncbi:DegT/DnrJ/EryC1/StrS family aminotransferase [Marinobacteraceae bacterium S3BR75-40.1]
MIQVTKPVIPELSKVTRYLERIHERVWLTNNGPLVQELTERLQDYLGVRNLLLTSNGTSALQVAYKALGVENEAVTTPFTFIATASSMQWQGVSPRFADIEAGTLCLSPAAAESSITPQSKAVVPVHVYGNPCDVEAFQGLREKYSLPIVYDASHAFAVKYRGESLLNWGDASTLSFHATKLFHTVEGGAIVFESDEVFANAQRMINFGLGEGPENIDLIGLNAKMSEVHAAYGLCLLESIDQILEKRTEILTAYHEGLDGVVEFPHWREGATQNAAYAPVLLKSEEQCLKVLESLKVIGVFARRYFYPSLSELEVFANQQTEHCDNAVSSARRVLCLPVYPDLAGADVRRIIEAVKKGV